MFPQTRTSAKDAVTNPASYKRGFNYFLLGQVECTVLLASILHTLAQLHFVVSINFKV